MINEEIQRFFLNPFLFVSSFRDNQIIAKKTHDYEINKYHRWQSAALPSGHRQGIIRNITGAAREFLYWYHDRLLSQYYGKRIYGDMRNPGTIRDLSYQTLAEEDEIELSIR